MPGEDLRSICTEEIAVFQAFAHVISEVDKKFVVLDTAPTGHTLLLLDATGAYAASCAHGQCLKELVREKGISETGSGLIPRWSGLYPSNVVA